MQIWSPLWQRLLPSAFAIFLCCCLLPSSISAADYSENENDWSETDSGMFFYDYADGEEPETPAEELKSYKKTRKARPDNQKQSQLIIVEPPREFETRSIELPQPDLPKAPPVKKPLSEKKLKPEQPINENVNSPVKKATAVSRTVKTEKKTQPAKYIRDTALPEKPLQLATPTKKEKEVPLNDNSKSRPAIEIIPELPIKKEQRPAADVQVSQPVISKTLFSEKNMETDNGKKVILKVPEKEEQQKTAASDNHSQTLSAVTPVTSPAPAKVSEKTAVIEKQSVKASQSSQPQALPQKPVLEPEKPEIAYVPPIVEKLEVQEFVASPVAGKPSLDDAGNMIHFYSDPEPLVPPAPPDPNYDPDFADFELSRVLPVINAPDGLYGFSYSGEGLQIAASHTYDSKEIQAGQVVPVNMIITNNSGLIRTFSEQITAPEGVRGVNEISNFEIAAGQSTQRRISLHLAPTLVAGEHKVSYQVSCKVNPKILGALEFGFAIKALPKLEFAIASAPETVGENENFKVIGRLINSGNTGLNAHLSLKGAQKDLKISPARISLPSGGHALIEIEGMAPSRDHPLDDVLQINLSAITDKKSGSLQLLDEPIKLRIGSRIQTTASNKPDNR